MEGRKATTAIFIDKYHPKAGDKCAISIRVTYDRKKKYYPTPISLTKSDFEKAIGLKPRNELKEVALKMQAYESKAVRVIEALPIFTWKGFEKNYLTNRAAKDSLDAAFIEYAQDFRKQGRIGTAVSYECAQKSLNKFAPDAQFAEVTPDFLNKYEKWMLDKGNSVTTINIYLRSLRSIFNNAISEGLLSKELYPFGRKKYEIPTANNVKKALTLKDIAAIYYHQPKPGTIAEMSKDYWMFMYLCNGINVKDMCLLKYSNLKDGILEFERAKTIRTKRKVEPIRVTLLEDISIIIKKWGNKRTVKEPYIFPVLSTTLTPERERQLIQQLTHVINDNMKVIVKSLGIEKNVTTYAARHSFATVLKRSGASTEFISEALGHSNVRTTQNYLAGFEDDHKKEMAKALTAFKMNKTDDII